MRAIAVLLVFVFHAARPGLPGGFIGVDVFFVLSGYLITRILLIERVNTGRIRIAAFYARRVRRLVPAVVVLVIVVVMHEALWGSVLESAARLRDAVATLFYVENWNLILQADQYFAESLSASPLRHAWSLSIEEQFYLLWPLALFGILIAAKNKAWRVGTVIAVFAAISAVAMVILFEPGLVARAYYGTDARVQQPLIGGVLAVIVWKFSAAWDSEQPRRPWLWPAVAVLSFAILLWAARVFTGDSSLYYLGGSTIIAVVTAALIYALERTPSSLPSRWLSVEPMRQLGRISYGFYLWHWPVILWLTVPAGFTFWERRMVNLAQFGLTLALSIASFTLIETPIRERRLGLAKLTPRATVMASFGVLLLAGALSYRMLNPGAIETSVAIPPGDAADVTLAGETGSSLTPEELEQLAAAALQDPSYEPCPDNPRPCVKVEPTTPDAPTVVLIGDSTAQAYDPALKALAQEYGFRYVHAAVGGCPISHRLIATGADGELHKPSNFLCYDEIPGIYAEVLADYDPDLFIATSWNETNQHVEGNVLFEKGTTEHLNATEAALRATVNALTANGARVAFIDVLPPGVSVDCINGASGGPGACVRPVSPGSGEAPYNALFAKLAAEMAPTVASISLTDLICPDNECPLVIDGMVIRYDGGHLTATASRWLAPALDARLRNVGVDLAAIG